MNHLRGRSHLLCPVLVINPIETTVTLFGESAGEIPSVESILCNAMDNGSYAITYTTELKRVFQLSVVMDVWETAKVGQPGRSLFDYRFALFVI